MGVPRAIVEETQGTSQRRRAEGNGKSALIWGRVSHKPLGAGVESRAVVKRERRPQTPPRRAFWGNDLEGTNKGTILARCPKRRGAAGADSFFLCRCQTREKRTPQPPLFARPPRHSCLRDSPPDSSTASHLLGAFARGRATALPLHHLLQPQFSPLPLPNPW